MNSNLMRRVAFTLGVLLVYRIGTFTPLPGIDPAVWEQVFRGQSGDLLGMLSLFSGGAVSRMAIFALNLNPYLSAAILAQLALLFSSRLRAVNDRGLRFQQIANETFDRTGKRQRPAATFALAGAGSSTC